MPPDRKPAAARPSVSISYLHRDFARRLEKSLQEVHCTLAIPLNSLCARATRRMVRQVPVSENKRAKIRTNTTIPKKENDMAKAKKTVKKAAKKTAKKKKK
ncbi:MAG TPA: hypothetical protein VHF69_01555 [Candidatus Synoicihabitans sp.]|nr:hypothetical protein [Candidatus Synoicihabitans sp.]